MATDERDSTIPTKVDPVAAAEPDLPAPEVFAGQRFRPVRFHRQGGQGEVFLAHDADLDRPVALKRLRPRTGPDPAGRRRFVREAAVCGRLQHPGTVPVYGLGSDAAGRPYYAMRFVEGESLADAVHAFHHNLPIRGPVGPAAVTFRQLLTRFVTVCQTVAYAHSQGVVHRDLKPQNILLGPFGETLVVDWGLAKIVGPGEEAEVRSQKSEVRPADSPGSAQKEVDPEATEVGAVLGTAAFMSPEQARGSSTEIGPTTDVYGLGATLYAVLTGQPPVGGTSVYTALEEVRRGVIVPPREKSPWVPPALDAICRKALAADPADRYAAALDLAADLDRWLADEPVSCYRESLAARARRWLRRHARLTAAVAAAVLVGVVALGLLAWQSDRARRTLADERDAKEEQRLRAVTARNHTRAALDAMTSEVTGDALTVQRSLSPEQRRFLQGVVKYYEEFAAEPGEDREGRERLAMAHDRLGLIRGRLGQADDGATVFRRCAELYAELAAEHPDVPEYRAALARSRTSLGKLLASLGRLPAAEAEYRTAIRLQEQLATDQPGVPEHRQDLARTQANQGVLLAMQGRWTEAEATIRAALSVQERLATEQPGVPEYRRELARSQTNLGNLLAGLGRKPEAEAAYRAAVTIYEPLTKEFPETPDYRNELAAGHNNLGYLLAVQSRWADAETAYRAALAVREKLAADFPGAPAYAVDLGGTCCNLGDLLRERGDPQAALPLFARAIDVLGPIHARTPRNVTARQFLRNTYWGRAVALGKLGRHADAVTDWDRAIDLSDAGGQPGLRLLRADCRVRAGDIAGATAEADKLAADKDASADTLYGAACIHALSAAAVKADVDRHASRAVALLRQAIERGYADVAHLRADTDLEALRGREDFKVLVAGLGAKKKPE
jgi:tetratricopeptide (TPR) repeat protein